jgi:hypothetical protein
LVVPHSLPTKLENFQNKALAFSSRDQISEAPCREASFEAKHSGEFENSQLEEFWDYQSQYPCGSMPSKTQT